MFNEVTIIGNLGRDPELRFTPSGDAVCNASIASSRKFKKKDELVEEVTWFKLTIFGKQAENFAKYLTKGSQIFVKGPLSIEEWTGRDGEKMTTLKVNVEKFQMLGSKQDKPQASAPAPSEEPASTTTAPAVTVNADDDIDF